MKILRLFTALFIAAMTIAACDDTTDNIGSSITNDVDNISIKDQVFNVTSRSIVSGPVLSRNNTGMIGNVKDPETGTYVAGDYMTQFGVLSSFSLTLWSTSAMHTKAGSRQTHAISWYHTRLHTVIPSHR